MEVDKEEKIRGTLITWVSTLKTDTQTLNTLLIRGVALIIGAGQRHYPINHSLPCLLTLLWRSCTYNIG